MQAAAESPTPAPHAVVQDGPAYWQWPVPVRQSKVVAGVAAGLAEEIGVDPVWVRLAFVAWFVQGGWGLVLYLGAWAVLSTLAQSTGSDPTPLVRTPKGRSPRLRLAGVAALAVGVAVFIGDWPGLPPELVAPIGFLGVAAVLSYRATQRTGDAWSGPLPLVGATVAALVGLGILVPVGLQFLGTTAWVAGIVATVALVSTAPWWWRLVRDLDQERQARVRADERAEVAAHLHDSVLQTLTLIQKADDPAAVRHLARRQERELRNWLDPARVDRQGRSLRGRLDELADDVEALHGVRVEVVVVGDRAVDERIDAMVGAAREAAVNSAKHAGVDRVDLFAEVGDDAVEIFVRDTGCGFDPDTVPADRLGLSESIRGRMRRAGGTTRIESRPGGGTEIELTLPLDGSVGGEAEGATREGGTS